MLISHQKAKHFKCERCNKRLNTAGGLSVHMNQVHKESLHQVENALSNRQGLDVEIFGMEGVPEDIIREHTQRILQSYYTAQAERQAATGNPPAGHAGSDRPRKPPVKDLGETAESIKARLRTYRSTKAERAAQAGAGDALPHVQSHSTVSTTYPLLAARFGVPIFLAMRSCEDALRPEPAYG